MATVVPDVASLHPGYACCLIASAAKRPAYGVDNPILVRLVEIGMHRQADHFLPEPLAPRQPPHPRARSARGPPAAAPRNPRGGPLPVPRPGIVDRGRDALRLERADETVATGARQPDRVLRPYRRHAVGQVRNRRDVGERSRIAPGDALARRDLLAGDLELLDQHRSLDGVEAPVETD